MKSLENILSRVAETKVEITIRGEKKFTFSFEGENNRAANRIKSYFGERFNWNSDSGYDEECDLTCLFAECK